MRTIGFSILFWNSFRACFTFLENLLSCLRNRLYAGLVPLWGRQIPCLLSTLRSTPVSKLSKVSVNKIKYRLNIILAYLDNPQMESLVNLPVGSHFLSFNIRKGCLCGRS